MKTGVLDSRHWLNSALSEWLSQHSRQVQSRPCAGRSSSFLKQSRFLTRGLWDSDRFKKEPAHDCFKKQSSKQLTNNGPPRGASFETSSIWKDGGTSFPRPDSTGLAESLEERFRVSRLR